MPSRVGGIFLLRDRPTRKTQARTTMVWTPLLIALEIEMEFVGPGIL